MPIEDRSKPPLSRPREEPKPAPQAELLRAIDLLERGIERHAVRSHQADELLHEALATLKGIRDAEASG